MARLCSSTRDRISDTNVTITDKFLREQVKDVQRKTTAAVVVVVVYSHP